MSTKAFQAVTRFGLGARNDEIKFVSKDPVGWLMDQMNNPQIPDLVKQRLGAQSLLGESLKAIRNTNKNQQQNDQQNLKDQQAKEEIGKRIHEMFIRETSARIKAQIQTKQPFYERMVLFWSNHFTVSIQKGTVRGLVNQFEVDAIRPYINGYFKDMLLAVTKHPAMLMYLDNFQSFGPNSKFAERRNRGLNENLAREILELHTLGVDGGYTQNDVTSFAKILTGWTLKRGNDGPIIEYDFIEEVHEPGWKILLGKRFNENGEREGIDALMMLANHPSTAKHIATKLVRHFVDDNPPANAVEIVAQSFIDSQGHLPTVMAAVIDLKVAWTKQLNKFKNPYEYYISALRLLDFNIEDKFLIPGLRSLNFMPFSAESPAGYGDTEVAWLSPDSLMKRIEWSMKIARFIPPYIKPLDLAYNAFADAMSIHTRQSIELAASGIDGIGLMLVSPEFLRR